MAIFQVRDLAAARRRVAGLGVRVVWTADLPDIAATHLHPADVPGAIVSLDWAAPEQSWRWAGPSWTGRVPEHAPGGVTGLTIEVNDPAAAVRRWAVVLGISAAGSGHTMVVELPHAGQRLRFVPARGGRGEGITEVTIAGLPGGGPWVIGGVRFAGEEGRRGPGPAPASAAARLPGLRPAVHQQQRRALAAGDRVLAQVPGVDVPAGERAGEPVRQVRRARD